MTASLWASVAFCRAFDIVYVKLPITILPNSQTSGSSSLSPLKKNEKSKLTDHRKNLLFTYLWNPKVELIHRNSIFHEKKIAINYIGPTSFRASVVTKFRSHVTLEEMRISCIFWSCCRASLKKKQKKSKPQSWEWEPEPSTYQWGMYVQLIPKIPIWILERTHKIIKTILLNSIFYLGKSHCMQRRESTTVFPRGGLDNVPFWRTKEQRGQLFSIRSWFV